MVIKSWLNLIQAQPEIHQYDDINAEARDNLWRFSPYEDEKQFSLKDLKDFINDIMAFYQKQLSLQYIDAMRFYCWHEAQIRTLNFSLISPHYSHLPFGCHYQVTDNLDEILQPVIEDWFNSEADIDSELVNGRFTLLVFQKIILQEPTF